MTEADLLIEPWRGRKEKMLPARALLVANPSEADYALDSFSPHVGERRTLYQTNLLVDAPQTLVLAGPALGAAAAVLVLEKLIVLGVRELWLVSCCGSLDPSWSIGDIVLADSAVCGEGVSGYYSPEKLSVPGTAATCNLEGFASRHWVGWRRGTIWSTDAPYRERRSELLSLQEKYGVLGVDMEFSALCTVAAFRGISLGALFVVSDMLWTKNWKPGFGVTEFKKSSRELIDKLISHGRSKEQTP